MFDASPANLRQEIEGAMQLQRRHTEMTSRIIRQYAGAAYRSDWIPESENYENHPFEFLSNIVPAMVYNNPQVDVETDGPFDEEAAADAVRYGLNGWIQKFNLAGVLEDVAYDLCLGFGVTFRTLADEIGENGFATYSPVVLRLPPTRFFTDPLATDRRSWRYRGHLWIRDIDDVLAEVDPVTGQPVFDRAAVLACGTDAGSEEARKRDGTRTQDVPTRKQIVGYDVYVRETRTVYTIGWSGDSAKYLRQPYQYMGHAQHGPYTLFGAYVVPNQVYPLCPLAVTDELVAEIDIHRGQASEDAASAKRIIGVDATEKELLAAVRGSVNGSVVPIPGLATGKAQQFEFGGVQKANVEYIQYLEEKLFRRSGLNEAVRGEITGNATATEVGEAAAANDRRTRYLKQGFRTATVELLEGVAHDLWEIPQIVFDVSYDDPVTGEKVRGRFEGGSDGRPFGNLRLTIEPYSMEYADQAVLQKRTQDAFAIVTQAAPLMIQVPWIRWQPLIDDMFESLNIRKGGRRYVDWEALRMMQGVNLMGQLQAAAGVQDGTESSTGGGGGSGERSKGGNLSGAVAGGAR